MRLYIKRGIGRYPGQKRYGLRPLFVPIAKFSARVEGGGVQRMGLKARLEHRDGAVGPRGVARVAGVLQHPEIARGGLVAP